LIAPSVEYYCGLEEHTHGEACYNESGELICELAEHVHGEECVIAPSVEYYCGLEEHVHGEVCYNESGELICELTEHVHSEECLIAPSVKYYCGLEEHTHGEACYNESGELICELTEHVHGEECLIPHYICGKTEHAHEESCYDADGNLICGLEEHIHGAGCLADPGYFCGKKAHAHGEECYDADGVLICALEEHAHTLVCTVDLSDLSEDIRIQVAEVITLIESMPSVDQIEERIAEYEALCEYEQEEIWLMQVYQQVFEIYRRYACLPEYAQERVINRDKLLELEFIWSMMVLIETPIAQTIAYDPAMFDALSAAFVIYTEGKDGNCYAFDGNGNAIPITISSDGTIMANIVANSVLDNKNNLLWSFARNAGEDGWYFIQNVSTARYMHAFDNAGTDDGVTTRGRNPSLLTPDEDGEYVTIQGNKVFAYLDEENQVFLMNDGREPAKFKFGVTYERYVWFDGTNGGLMALHGSDNVGQPVSTDTIILPTEWKSPEKYSYELRGWYDVVNRKYYKPGEEVTIEDSTVFYADWVAATYNVGQNNGYVSNTISTNDFITTRLFDYSSMFNMYSAEATVSVSAQGHDETWRMTGEGPGFIFLDYDTDNKTLSRPSNKGSGNTNQSDPTLGLYNWNLAQMLFNPSNSFDPDDDSTTLGMEYIGTADHLFHYGTDPEDDDTYGYYYYDSALNAASYNQSRGRFYVYNYLEATSDSLRTSGEYRGKYSDFLPFNSPYANTNGRTPGSSGQTSYIYDAKDQYGGSPSDSYDNVGTNYWVGMSTEIRFYLPNEPGTTDGTGNRGNQSFYGDDLIFEFAGDDDVWIFIDGKMVLDIGGMHGIRGGVINFAEGTVQRLNSSLGFTGDAWALGDLEPGEHTLTMYYLERGSSQSNCRIRFNICPRYTLTIQKEDVLTQELLNGAEFSVFIDPECTEPAQLWMSRAEYIRNPQGHTNVFRVGYGIASMWGFAAGATYYIKETKAPAAEGYELPDGIIKMTLNNLGTASYEVIPDPTAETAERSAGFTVYGYQIDFNAQEAFIVFTNGRGIDETTNIYVEKRWDDGQRHISTPATVYLLADGQKIREVTLNSYNDWHYLWTDLPKYRQAEGSEELIEIVYTVEEAMISGYTGKIESVLGEDGTVPVRTWESADAFADGGVFLLQSENGYLAAYDGSISWISRESTAKVSLAARWTPEVTGNSVVLKNEAGQILYRDDDGYHAREASQGGTQLTFSDGKIQHNSGRNTYYLTGTLQDGTLSASQSSDDALIFTLLREMTTQSEAQGFAYRITNTEIPKSDLVSLTVNKQWDLGTHGDESMYEDLEIVVRLLKNNEDSGVTRTLSLRTNWMAVFEDLPKYDSSGAEIEYAIVEELDASGIWKPEYGELTPVDESADAYTMTITNVCHLAYELPETGGPGTFLYTAGGLLLMLSAGVLLMYSKKTRNGKEGGYSL